MPIFGMLNEKQLTLDGIRNHDVYTMILKRLHKKDQADMRLVCKAYACKGPNWTFMPDNLEKKYDKKRKQKNKCKSLDSISILFDCTTEDDLESIQWIIDNLPFQYRYIRLGNTGIKPHPQRSLYPSMIAIQKNKPEIARLLFESEHHPQYRSWKSYYDEISVPNHIRQCLYTDTNRDFSFLFYLNAVWSDNVNNLKKLYEQKIPTNTGQTILIRHCFEDNAQYCCAFLLTQETIKEIIHKYNTEFFTEAIETYRKEIPKKLLEEKLFDLNGSIGNNQTILDYYYDNKNAKAIALLETLGARRYIDLIH